MKYDLSIGGGVPKHRGGAVPLHMLNCSSWGTDGLVTAVRWFSETMLANNSGVYVPEGDADLPCVVVFVDQKRSSETKRGRRINPLIEGRTSLRGGDSVVVIAIQHPAHLKEQGVVEQLVMQNEPLAPMNKDMMTELINVMQQCVGSLQLWARSAPTSQYDLLSTLRIDANERPQRKKPKVLGQILSVQATKRAVRLARSRCFDASREYHSAQRHMTTAVRHCSADLHARLKEQHGVVRENNRLAGLLMDSMMADINDLNAQIVSLLNGGNDAKV